MIHRLWPTVVVLGFGVAGPAAATTQTVMVGDDDCFGYASLATCPDGAVIPGVAPVDNSEAGDPVGTDTFGALGTLGFDFLIDLNGETATAASASIRTAGLDLGDKGAFGDAFSGSRFLFNGTDVGVFFADVTIDPNAPVNITTLGFDVLGLLQDGVNTLTVIPEEAFERFGTVEEYAVDFARLTVETTTAPVPLPASIWMLAAAFGFTTFAWRRR